MGYFTRLQKRARNESGWSGYSYTGTAAAGTDLVSEDTWCVVYGADVVYESERERLSALSVATNFVNPLSSGNPCTVCCYLYTSDPTLGGSFDVSAPPPGYAASAWDSFEAGTAGSYIVFSFPGLDMRPGRVYFWFTSTVSYESYGSNRIYHYATGNYIAALNTGTRTPALYGGFTGGGAGSSGGTDSGGEYTAVASGSYSSIFAQRDFSLSRTWHSASYTALSFTGSGTARFSCTHAEGGDSFLQLRSYMTRGSGFDKASGTPTGTVLAFQSGGDSCGFECAVESGQTYYLWNIIDYCGTDTVPLEIRIIPASWSYSISDKGSSSNIPQSERSYSMSMGAFQTGRMALSFAYSSSVDISVTAGEAAFDATVFVSRQPNIDSATGRPLEYEGSFSKGYGGSMRVEKGVTYYFFTVYNGGSEAGSLGFTITPPPELWTLGGSNSYSLLKTEVSPSISLGAEKYHRIKLSAAYAGLLQLSADNVSAGSGSMYVYISESDSFDSYWGSVEDSLRSFVLDTGMDMAVDIFAGHDYYIYVLNTEPLQSLSARLNIKTGSVPDGYMFEMQQNNNVESSVVVRQSIRRYSYCINVIKFKYRGEARIGMEKSETYSEKTVHLRAYLCSEKGIDKTTGVPTGEVLASCTGGGESYSFTLNVEEERAYYLYTVCEEIYDGYTAGLRLSLISPPERFFSVTESGEYPGLSEPVEYSASPGESGVLRLELSLLRGGVAKIRALPRSGTDYLMGWVSLSPYLDGYSGSPAQNIVKSASGSNDAPGLDMSFPVRGLTSYYLFIRGRGLYDQAEFDLSLSCGPASAGLYAQGKFIRAQPLVYHNGQWHAAMPCGFGEGSWRG